MIGRVKPGSRRAKSEINQYDTGKAFEDRRDGGERFTIEIQIRIKEIAIVFSPRLKLPILPIRLCQEPLLPRRLAIWDALRVPKLFSISLPSFFKHHALTVLAKLNFLLFLRR
jgi:hypothetical protein